MTASLCTGLAVASLVAVRQAQVVEHKLHPSSFVQSLQTNDSKTFCSIWLCAYLRQSYSSCLTCRYEFLQSQSSPQQKYWLSEDNSKCVSAQQIIFLHPQETITCNAWHHFWSLLLLFLCTIVCAFCFIIWKRKFLESFKFLLKISFQVHTRKKTIRALHRREEVLAINHWDQKARRKDLYCLFTFP